MYLNGSKLSTVDKFLNLGHIGNESLGDNDDTERERRALTMMTRKFVRCLDQVKLTLFKH